MLATYKIVGNSANGAATTAFARDVLQGLSQHRKSLPSRYFYDQTGSRLFQRITELDEYYLTRAEREILETYAPEMVESWHIQPLRLVELGVGDGEKTKILLRHFLSAGLPFDYTPVDICRDAMAGLTRSLETHLGRHNMRVRGVVAEYFDALSSLDRHDGHTMVLFLGSNIGNLRPDESRRFLQRVRRTLVPGDRLLIGFDLKKDPALLLRAYNDAQGVTREFNFNLLDRINRELGGRFDRALFKHYAPYNVACGRMESWLVSLVDQRVVVRGLGRVFKFAHGEGIHVECSYKYTVEQIDNMARASGFKVRRNFFDRRGWFVDSLWETVPWC